MMPAAATSRPLSATEYKKAKYKADPVFREKVLAINRKAHARSKMHPCYVKLIVTRKRIRNAKNSIKIHQQAIVKMWLRIERLTNAKEALELEFGAIRAQRKRGK
jgi:hypothetical protein